MVDNRHMVGRTRSVSDAEIIEAIKDSADPVVGASEVADTVGLTRQRVNELLNNLEDEGLLRSKQLGSGVAWWLADRQPSSVNSSSRKN